jgi:DNA-binding response OmpR family regulator
LSERFHKLWKDGAEIVLTPTEWALVKLLMERCGQSVSRDEILTEVWGRYYVGDLKVVDVNIRRIRRKIESNPSEPAIIETVWGFGYRWNRGGA